jgi:sugar lactone lactonase YvrE
VRNELHGRCLQPVGSSSQYCAFGDVQCPDSNLRWDRSAGEGYAGQCVMLAPGTDFLIGDFATDLAFDKDAEAAVVISPSPAYVLINHTLQLSANVPVTWSVQSGGGTIDATGLFTAPASEESDVVVAQSIAYPGNSATATVTVAARLHELLVGQMGGPGYYDDTGTLARFFFPAGALLVGTTLYVVDGQNDCIRTIETSTGAVSTFSGVCGQPGGDDMHFYDPIDIAYDGSTYFYVTDRYNHVIRRVDKMGKIATVAGVVGSADVVEGKGALARFHEPFGIAYDGAGILYVSEIYSDVIRKIDINDGFNSTVLAGTKNTPGAMDATGTAATFRSPAGVTFVSGNLYVADSQNHTIRQVTPAGVVSLWAGSPGTWGGQSGPRLSSTFNGPVELTSDAQGNLIVSDQSNFAVRRVPATGDVTTVAGVIGQAGNVDGDASTQRLGPTFGIALSGNTLYVVTGEGVVRQEDLSSNHLSTLAGLGMHIGLKDGKGTGALLASPTQMAFDNTGALLVVELNNHLVRKIDPVSGQTSIFAGTGGVGANDGPKESATFHVPFGIAVDKTTNDVYVADQQNQTIRKISATTGDVSLFAGTTGVQGTNTNDPDKFIAPQGIAVDGSGNVYSCSSGDNRIRKITPAGVASFFAGSGVYGYLDANGLSAQFAWPRSLLVVGNDMYVADQLNQVIRKVSLVSPYTVSTVAGTADMAGSDDGTPGKLWEPAAITQESNTTLLVGEYMSSRVRRIDLANSNQLSTVIGVALQAVTRLGTFPGARINRPYGVAASAAGDIFISNYYENVITTIRKP